MRKIQKYQKGDLPFKVYKVTAVSFLSGGQMGVENNLAVNEIRAVQVN